MQTLTETDYSRLREGGRVIETDGFGDKVIKLENGNFLKLFRRKRRFSSALLSPYSSRFAKNAGKLARLDIPTVKVESVYKIPAIDRTAVHYRPLPGETLRDWLVDCSDMERLQLARDLGRFIARLHLSGVYFRSLHLGNILKMPDGRLGLIDISDMRCKMGSLREGVRLRNFRHLARYRDDIKLMADTTAILAESYNEMAATSKGFRQKLNRILAGK